ncbi:cell wall hydrolase [Natronospora cellulosivora (SeqCode)]
MNKKFLLVFLLIILVLFIYEVEASNNYNLVLGERVLRRGDEGADVAILQQKLRGIGLYEDRVDGLYGANTKQAVRNLQRKNNLTVDGVAGPKTLAVLPQSQLSSRMDVSRDEIIQLAYVIHGEARGENFRGQVAVGAVVLNRVKDDRFPNNIREVVTQRNQFSCFLDGQVNYYPSQTSIEAARAALLGYDPTYGALFFYNPRIATNLAWISQRPIVIEIGNHVFAK